VFSETKVDIIDDTEVLFDKLKDETLKVDSFDTFLRVMNKFLRVNQAESSKEMWKLLDDNISKIISGNFSDQPEK
jgi:hypothetical protein